MTDKNYLALFAKSFNWAGFFLPKNIYQDCSNLYAFCRILDDVVDEKTNLELRTERFNKIQDFIQRSYEQNDNNRTLEDWHEHGSIINEMIVIADRNSIKKIILDDEENNKDDNLNYLININA